MRAVVDAVGMSREAELYKDKIEVSLDGRQIFYLFFGGAVIVGLVFVLGVMVGRRVEARGHVDRARVAATVDPLAALDRLEGGTGLSFQGSLRGGETPANDVEKQIAAMQKTDAKATKLEAKVAAKAEPKPADKVEDKKVDKPTVKLDAGKPEDKPKAAVADKKLEDGNVADKKVDDKTAEKTDKTEKTEKKSAEASDEKKAKFTLQLSSFQDKREAQTYLDSIKSSGYQAYVTEGAVDGKQYFRVRLGAYRSLDAAMEAKTEFEKDAKKIAIVTRL